MASGDLGDRGGQHLEVIGSGVGPSITGTQPCCKQFGGVVTTHYDRVKPETALEGWCRSPRIPCRTGTSVHLHADTPITRERSGLEY